MQQKPSRMSDAELSFSTGRTITIQLGARRELNEREEEELSFIVRNSSGVDLYRSCKSGLFFACFEEEWYECLEG